MVEMMTRETAHCSFETALNFIILTLIRGTTPLMLYYATQHLHSAGLIVSLKCATSLIFFGISAYLLMKPAMRTVVRNNLLDKSTYSKLFFIGVLQSAVPYLLLAYSVKYVPITLVGVFMVITPWWIHMIECSFSNESVRFPTVLKIGIILGMFGISIMIVPVFVKTSQCIDNSDIINQTVINGTYSNNDKFPLICHSIKDVLTAVIALSVVPIFWGAAGVFWKRNQGEVHFVVASLGQNVFGGLIGVIAWFLMDIIYETKTVEWNRKSWIIYVVYLGAAAGWLGTLLLRNICTKVGSKTANQVLTGIPLIVFIEDCIFIRDIITSTNILGLEILGLILLTVGIFVSNVPSSEHSVEYTRSRGDLTEHLLTSDDQDDGLSAGLDQILKNQVHQYDEMNDLDDTEHELIEPLFPPLGDNIRVNFPTLSEVESHDILLDNN